MEAENIRLTDIWAAEQSILDEIHRICSVNHLRYSLAYGTLLGAVRHGGFIPWDDDIDIMMPREDYDKLRALWPEQAAAGFLYDCCELDPENRNTFSKIRKDHTTYLQKEAERNEQHPKGFFVDIFPGERVAPGKLSRLIQYMDFALELLFNRGHTSGMSGPVGIGERVLLWIVPKRRYHAFSLYFGRRGRRWNHRDGTAYVFPSTIRDCRLYYPADLFDDLEEISFSGKKYSTVREKDLALRTEYGDYMRLPPLEERVWKHCPILVDFSRNYEELTEKEKYRPQKHVGAAAE